MLKKIIFLSFLIGLSTLSAQSFNPNFFSTKQNSKISQTEATQLNILAVMVDFQVDDFSLTYGDGTFGSIYSEDQNYGNSIIDPLPHDKNYFEDHLEFAVNYYNKNSNGLVSINYNVLPDVVTVSKPMREYSPTEGENFQLLADFSEEVWGKVNSSNSSFDFSQYNVFIIFHAGTGKDISTSDLFGEARDLPSIYLGINTLKDLYGESFTGYQMNDGTLITNSLILPETESREESGIGGTVLIELSINGLIVSSLASHMGLPDLFDAETGKSAIGRFGLMDGQSLFAYAGLFPPEPSAWEKIFLGWEEPTIINANTNNIEIVARQIANSADIKIAKVPINSTEYYLIENRARDANGNGATITYKLDGQLRTITFSEDLDNFNNAVVDTLQGVVVDVDEFDWAIPGNGILIWHIDEKIISAGLETNKINVGENRGVDLEEADGIQDIGEEFSTIFGDVIIAEGEAADFWFSSNESRLFNNTFGIDSKPNTNSNSGSNSLITFSNFSDISNRMRFDLSLSTNNILLVNKYEANTSLTASSYKTNSIGDQNIGYFLSNNSLHRVDDSIQIVDDFSSNNISTIINGEDEFIFGGIENLITVATFTNNQFTIQSMSVDANITAPILIYESNGSEIQIFVGLEDGNVKGYNFNLTTSQFNETPIAVFKFADSAIKQVAFNNGVLVCISEDKFHDVNTTIDFQSSIKKMLFTTTKNNQALSIILSDDNSIHTYFSGEVNSSEIYTSDNNIESIAIADLKNDGDNYIIFTEENRIMAVNISGSNAYDFAPEQDNVIEFIGTPLVADIDNDNFGDVISISAQGNVFAFSGETGNMISGFPISVGGSSIGNQTIIKRESDLLLSVGTSNNEFYSWSLNSTGAVQWGSEYGNNWNSSFLSMASSDNYVDEYFPLNRTYNWPNPTYSNETFIRTYVAEDSEVKVTIFDLAGDLVDELEFFASGGVDVEATWDVSQIQSGAYIAHVEVNSNSGKTESKIIKIAVVK